VADGANVTICGRTEEKLRSAVAILVAVEPSSAAVGTAASVVADAKVEDQVRATIDLNLVGTFLCIKHGAPVMGATVGTGVDGGPAGGGSFIGMSSGAGSFPHRYLWAYGSAKAGIDMLCKYAAEELGRSGIRVNTAQPGIVDDELMAPITAGGDLLDDYLAEMPISRLGTVEDIASAVRFLAGPESSWISGESIAVDGGHHLRRGANYGLLFGE
jgi:NAD(P)-dependent dehydrogenase (short-subunit alcohol dehydrogenase family)